MPPHPDQSYISPRRRPAGTAGRIRRAWLPYRAEDEEAIMKRLDARHCSLVLVDYQARLMPAIHDGERVVANALLLADAARLLGVPVLGTEQNLSLIHISMVRSASISSRIFIEPSSAV